MSRRAVSEAASGGDPLLFGTADCPDSFEVGIVVKDNESGRPGGCRDDDVGDGQPVLSSLGQLVLEVDGEFEYLWRDRGAVEAATFEENRFVVSKSPAGVQHLQVDDCTGGDQALFEEWPESRLHGWIREAGESALVGQEAGVQRHAPDITEASSRSSPVIVPSRSA